jgi:hypothetical protein
VPIETFGSIDALNSSNPIPSEGLVGGDDHIRGIKATLKTTFPNISGAVTATHTQINAAVTAVVTNGVAKLDDAGVFFKTSGDGFVNTLAGDIDVKLQGVIGATFQRTAGTNFFKVTGQIEATTLKGGGMVPIGGVLIWPSDTLPPTTEGTFVWCNGAAYSKTTYATAYERIGNSVDATTFAVPNYQEVVLVGKSGMGGAASPGLLASIATGVKNVLNALFGNDTKALSVSNLPPYTPAGSITNGAIKLNGNNSVTVSGTNATAASDVTPGSVLGAYNQVTITPSQLASTFSGTAQGGTSEAFGLHQPSKVTGFIIRLA